MRMRIYQTWHYVLARSIYQSLAKLTRGRRNLLYPTIHDMYRLIIRNIAGTNIYYVTIIENQIPSKKQLGKKEYQREEGESIPDDAQIVYRALTVEPLADELESDHAR